MIWTIFSYLIAAQKVFTCTETARCQRKSEHSAAQDSFTRLLSRKPPETEALWEEARGFVQLDRGMLVLDDTTLDKPYGSRIELVTYHWSGKHWRVVKGINLLTLLWTDVKALVPCDFSIYGKLLKGGTKKERAFSGDA